MPARVRWGCRNQGLTPLARQETRLGLARIYADPATDACLATVRRARRQVVLARGGRLVAAQHDAESVVAHVPQADLLGRVVLAAEVRLAVDLHQLTGVAQHLGDGVGRGPEPHNRLVVQGQFKGGCPEVVGQDIGVLRVHDRVFRGLGEKVFGVAQQVLIHRIVAGQQHGQAFLVPPAAPPGLLPRAGDRARIVHQQGHIQRADVDAQFQCIGGGDAAQPPLEQILLDLPPFLRKVSAPVGSHLARQTGE